MKKRVFLFGWVLAAVCGCWAQNVRFQLQAPEASVPVKACVERNISALLTEMNAADKANRPLQLSDSIMTDEARKSLCTLWDKYAHFVCEDNTIISKQTQTISGYQVREIFVMLHPHDASDGIHVYRELLVDYNKEGRITGVCLALEGMSPTCLRADDIIGSRIENEILYFLSKYIECYYTKDYKTLTSIIGKDGLSLTPNFEIRPDTFTTSGWSKKMLSEYHAFAESLKKLFDEKDPVVINLSDIELQRHVTKADFYCLSFKQTAQAGNGRCDGYVFILFQQQMERPIFTHIKTWQPDGTPLYEVYNMNDFYIP